MKLTPKKVKCTWPTPKFGVGYFRLACVWVSRRVKRNFKVSHRVKCEKFASTNAKDTNMLLYFALGDAKVWRWGSKPTPGPNANGFASQWNIGFIVIPSFILFS